jgi:PST family polysaccharide transporter
MNLLNFAPESLQRYVAQRPQLSKILENIGWLFFDKILRMGVGLLVSVWIARYLGPEQFGLLSFAIAFTWLFGAVSTLGLPEIIVRDLVRIPETKGETLGTAAILQLFGGVLTYGLILITIFWIRPDDTLAKVLVAILGSTMLFKASEIAIYWFESQVLSKYAVWVQNISFLIFASIKVLLILNSASLIAFAWASMAEALLAAVLLIIMLSKFGPRLQQLRVKLGRAKELLTDSWPLLLSSVAVTIYMKIDQIMLGQIVDTEAVGLYSAAVRISEVWYFIPVMIVTSVFPAILEAKKRSEVHYYQGLQHLYDLMVWMSVGVALPMTFLSTPIVTLLFGENFAKAGPVLAIHIWATVFVFLGVASSKWFLAENRQILNFQRTVVGAILNIILNFLLIPDFEAVGAAAATVVTYAIVALISDIFQKETRAMFFMKVGSFNLAASISRLRH